MFDYMMSKNQMKIRDEVRELVKWVPRQMILDMDLDKIKFPKEFYGSWTQESDGLPLSKEMGRQGHGLGDDLHDYGRSGNTWL